MDLNSCTGWFCLTHLIHLIGEKSVHLKKTNLIHPAGRALTSDWSTNSLIMVDNGCLWDFCLKFSQNFLFKARLKMFLQTTIRKLFTDQKLVLFQQGVIPKVPISGSTVCFSCGFVVYWMNSNMHCHGISENLTSAKRLITQIGCWDIGCFITKKSWTLSAIQFDEKILVLVNPWLARQKWYDF